MTNVPKPAKAPLDLSTAPRVAGTWSESDYLDDGSRKGRSSAQDAFARTVPKWTKKRRVSEELEMEKWYRLGWFSKNPEENKACFDAGRRLRDDLPYNYQQGFVDHGNLVAGHAYEAVYELVVRNKTALDIGKLYEQDSRAAKAVGRHLVRCGLEQLAKDYDLWPSNKALDPDE